MPPKVSRRSSSYGSMPVPAKFERGPSVDFDEDTNAILLAAQTRKLGRRGSGESAADAYKQIEEPGAEKSRVSEVDLEPPETRTITFHGQPVRYVLDCTGQHVLHWYDRLWVPSKAETVGPGTCNLYKFPTLTLHDEGERSSKVEETEKVDGVRLEILSHFLLVLDEADVFNETDGVGAYPIHGLLVCNTKPSVDIALQLIRHHPALLLRVHEPPGVFEGENCFHIVIVNRHESLFIELLRIAVKHFSTEQLDGLLNGCAKGVFFEALPMCHYGGTAVSYAAVFGMQRAILELLAHPALRDIVDLNDTSKACAITGFLPIHAVTANGLGAEPSPSPFTLTLHPHPSPSPFTLTLHSHPSLSPFTLTLHPYSSPSTSTFTLTLAALTHHPHPSPSPLNLSPHPPSSPLTSYLSLLTSHPHLSPSPLTSYLSPSPLTHPPTTTQSSKLSPQR